MGEATTEDDGAVAARITDGIEPLSCGELRKLEEFQSRLACALTDSACFPHESASAKVLRDLVR